MLGPQAALLFLAVVRYAGVVGAEPEISLFRLRLTVMLVADKSAISKELSSA